LIDALEGLLDLRVVPSPSGQRLYLFYGHDFNEGRCGVIDTASRLTSRLLFDPAIFRACWLFGPFGGWRNLNVALLEPSTGYPFELAKAAGAGNCYRLGAGEELRTTVRFEVSQRD
jgi:hypothetical protein